MGAPLVPRISISPSVAPSLGSLDRANPFSCAITVYLCEVIANVPKNCSVSTIFEASTGAGAAGLVACAATRGPQRASALSNTSDNFRNEPKFFIFFQIEPRPLPVPLASLFTLSSAKGRLPRPQMNATPRIGSGPLVLNSMPSILNGTHNQ